MSSGQQPPALSKNQKKARQRRRAHRHKTQTQAQTQAGSQAHARTQAQPQLHSQAEAKSAAAAPARQLTALGPWDLIAVSSPEAALFRQQCAVAVAAEWTHFSEVPGETPRLAQRCI